MSEGRKSLWTRTLFTIGIQQMAHRPPLPKRSIVYCVIAYLAPITALEALPDSLGSVREISWLITRAPAFILSLHFGMLGALAGMIAGTLLYITVQVVLDLNLVDIKQDIQRDDRGEVRDDAVDDPPLRQRRAVRHLLD